MKNPKVRLIRIEEVSVPEQNSPTVVASMRGGDVDFAPAAGKKVIVAGLEFIGQSVNMSYIAIPVECLPEGAKIGDEFYLFVEKSLE